MGLSTHILDTAIGRPAADVPLRLSILHDKVWQPLGTGTTDADGRCKTLLGEHTLEAATYKIRFDTASYYGAQNLTGLYPYVEIAFTIADPAQHYHIPLLLTANGYTTYRGS
jgi:5-hydroxyisourate hydrolase